ncbi:hypothetical protein FYJ28_04355 [Arthrobacter sp. BL-252-APC-1A]|uniref:hypothetical protein n=1 Tax=Arthrobacter sp. BL-252-APC-1A TaxID=2606622 RepID=UPI0012B3F2D4|nr:hypothetical protein [Arthrobacter sp. BL-252-APC-1A]MSR98052.1 hypothetical protein [Arthrobacter sp. BL-252-APC-1A]
MSLYGAEWLGYEETVSALQRLGMLMSWAQAQQARLLPGWKCFSLATSPAPPDAKNRPWP